MRTFISSCWKRQETKPSSKLWVKRRSMLYSLLALIYVLIASLCNDPLVYATLCSYLKDKNPKVSTFFPIYVGVDSSTWCEDDFPTLYNLYQLVVLYRSLCSLQGIASINQFQIVWLSKVCVFSSLVSWLVLHVNLWLGSFKWKASSHSEQNWSLFLFPSMISTVSLAQVLLNPNQWSMDQHL